MPPSPLDYEGLYASTIPPHPAFPSPLTEHYKYDFAVGNADPEHFPSTGLHQALNTALENEGAKLAFYPHPQGHPSMRDLLVENLAVNRSMKVTPDQIVLTAGSSQALVLFTELFVDPGDVLLTDEFIYMGTLKVMQRFQANPIGVATDEQGMRADSLEQAIRQQQAKGSKIKFIYTVPTFSNPLGSDMGLERRKQIVAVAQEHGIPIFEDDAYVDLRYDGEYQPALHSLDNTGSVLYCGTSSKIVGPGMRLGWLVAPEDVVKRVNTIHLGATPSQFSVLATLYYLQEHRDEHVAEVIDLYRSRRDVMLAALGEHFGSMIQTSKPNGGMYIWIKFPEGINTVDLSPKAKARDVRYSPGAAFSPDGGGLNYLRLCFAHMDEPAIREGVALLAKVFEEEGVLG